MVHTDWQIKSPPKLDSYREENMVSVKNLHFQVIRREFSGNFIDDFSTKQTSRWSSGMKRKGNNIVWRCNGHLNQYNYSSTNIYSFLPVLPWQCRSSPCGWCVTWAVYYSRLSRVWSEIIVKFIQPEQLKRQVEAGSLFATQLRAGKWNWDFLLRIIWE